MKTIDWIARILVIVGALNWGLAIWDINLVTLALGSIPILVSIVYALVALSGIWELIALFKK
ncbi:DUF378 domain-containing protein [Candidatus Pacearchaeota archaeon]|nr:DUF378 domain-containing protein [Candidatus Pacearchaeota archaeon]